MADLIDVLIELGCNDSSWQSYTTNPDGFLTSRNMSEADKTLLLTANNAANINQAIVDRGAGNRVEVAGAGHIKYLVTLRRS